MSEETEIKTLFKYIPARVITNDGLLNDIFGQSEIELLNDYESLYSKYLMQILMLKGRA